MRGLFRFSMYYDNQSTVDTNGSFFSYICNQFLTRFQITLWFFHVLSHPPKVMVKSEKHNAFPNCPAENDPKFIVAINIAYITYFASAGKRLSSPMNYKITLSPKQKNLSSIPHSTFFLDTSGILDEQQKKNRIVVVTKMCQNLIFFKNFVFNKMANIPQIQVQNEELLQKNKTQLNYLKGPSQTLELTEQAQIQYGKCTDTANKSEHKNEENSELRVSLNINSPHSIGKQVLFSTLQ